jgi:hypothetical protein
VCFAGVWATSYDHEYQAICRIEASPYGVHGALKKSKKVTDNIAGKALILNWHNAVSESQECAALSSVSAAH